MGDTIPPMLTLRNDGTLTIDFGDGPSVAVRRPLVGGLLRLRLEGAGLVTAQRDKLAELAAPVGKSKEPIPAAEQVERFQTFAIETVINWWRLALLGDETFKGLADGTVPADSEEWPAWMIEAHAIGLVISHWRSVPLALGDQPPTLVAPPTPPQG